MFSNGSKWLRIDYHLHTNEDREFKYTGLKYHDDYVEGLEKAGLQVGIITNHNKFKKDEYKVLKKKAKRKNIYLLPGVELSVKEGQNGIHTLIVFNENEWLDNGKDDINNFLNQVFTGKDNRESANSRCNEDIRGTIKKLKQFNKGFFIIFAHIEQKNGFLTELGGGTITDVSKSSGFREHVLGFQKLRTNDLMPKIRQWMGFLPALVEGSDPKCIDEIGKGESSYIKLGDYSFEAIQYALREKEQRIRTEQHCVKHAYVKSISFLGGLLNGKKINFSSELNTLIGIRGSGKSSVIEAIRYSFDQCAHSDKKYKDELVENTLASGGKIEIVLTDRYGKEYKISRILNKDIVIFDENGLEVEASIHSLINNPLYFGQKDLSDTQQGYEFILLEKLLGDKLNEVRKDITNIEGTLSETIRQWRKSGDIASKINDLKSQNSDLKHKIKIFSENGIAEKLQKQVKYTKDKSDIEKIIAKISETYTSLERFINNNAEKEYIKLKNNYSKYNQEKFDKINTHIDEVIALVKKVECQLNDMEKLKNKVKYIDSDLDSELKTLEDEFDDIKRRISKPDLKPDDYLNFTKQIDINNLEIESLRKLKKQKDDYEKDVKKMILERNNKIKEEYEIFKSEIKRVNLSQNELEISIEYKGDKLIFRDLIKEKLQGTGISQTKYEKIVKKFSDFADIFGDIYFNDGKILEEIITTGEYAKTRYRFDTEISNLINEKIPNKIVIEYKGKPLSKLSLGQRASALVLFILAQNDNDLIIIDQPEDDLDNKVIYEELINTLKEKKKDIQFIFATHNANIPVLGDADQIISTNCEEDSIDIEMGSIDKKELQDKIINIMEGGKDAFQKRNEIYKAWC